MTRQLLMQPVGLIKRPSGRGRVSPRLRRLDAKAAGISNKPIVMMTGPKQLGPPRLHLAAKKKSSAEEKERLKIWPNYYVVGPNLGGYTQWVR